MTSLYDRFVHKYSRLPTETDPDYLEMLQMSKYQITDVPMYKPGKCANCGSSKNDGRRYVDFGEEVDFYGTIFLCGLCLKDTSSAMGLFKALEDRVAELEAALAMVTGLQELGVSLHETVKQMFENFEDFYAGISAVGDNSSPDPTPDMDTNETDSDKSGTVEIKSGPEEPKQRAVKSTTSAGRKNVRSLAELLNEPAD